MENAIFLFLLLGSSFVPAIVIFFLKDSSNILRNGINIFGVTLKIALVAYIIRSINLGDEFMFRYQMVDGLEFLLKVDRLSMLFAILSAILWFFTTIYAIGYFKGELNQSRFFGFFSLCVTSTIGLSISGNLFTFFIFYEMLTLVTFPLILHNQNLPSKRASITYLKYTIFGGIFFLIGIIALYLIAGSGEFIQGGYLKNIENLDPFYLQIIFVILIIGIGVKAAIFPLHNWLPQAMAAPAPVSSLLHAVAVVKAGAFGIIRITYEVYGIELANSLGVLSLLMFIAIVTIIYGSIKALSHIDLKKRLAYSTVSQVSYIILGISIFGPLGTIGGIIHLVHQGVMKITLFFCAGAFAKTYNITKISDMNGLGKTMPISSISFSIAALGMIGIPPTAGFLTKWYLSLGAYESELWLVLGVIGISSLLNAAYYLPIIYRIWFLEPLEKEIKLEKLPFLESRALLLLPPLATAFFTIALGVFALSDFSALQWVNTFVQEEYAR